jgi:secretion/DNA translocation related TadE-like protein
VLAVAVLVGAVGGAAGLLAERQRLDGAADAAALAAAEAAVGRRPGDPCDEARRLAEANGAALDRCVVEGSAATVRVSSIGSPVPMGAAATAGRPTANTDASIDGSEK